MNNLQCPTCKQNIDGDSLYCDQCGEKIMVCSQCGRAGKGKRCIYDGQAMVEPGNAPAPTDRIPPQPSQPNQPPPPPPPPQPAAPGKLKLTSQVHGVVIEAQDGDILGRSKGNFAAILGRFSYLSGQHCQVNKIPGGWSIMDKGSTNGTFFNGSKLNPNTPVSLSNGSRVKLADVEFVVSFDTPNDGGSTERL